MTSNAEIKSKQEPFILFEDYLKPKKPPASNRNIFLDHRKQPKKLIKKKNHPFTKYLSKWKSLSKNVKSLAFKLFPFLKERNDDDIGVCKPKTGFEIYCDVASIHGFSNFNDATTQQRFFWTIVICTALALSIGMITVSQTRLNVETPTSFYVRSTTYPIWTMPFPGITICGLNRISKRALQEVSQELRISETIIRKYVWMHETTPTKREETKEDLKLLQSVLVNITWSELLVKLAPKCSDFLLQCKWQGFDKNCTELFQTIMTPDGGLCCAFNYHMYDESPPVRTKQCGYKSGISVLLDANFSDYAGAMTLTPGFQLRIHGSYKVPETVGSTKTSLVQSGTDTRIALLPHGTESTVYIRRENFDVRKCYFDGERRMLSFPRYSHTSCLAEYRSKLIFESCGCIPPFAAGSNLWPICIIEKAPCLRAHKRKSAQFNREYCDCFPHCNSYLYDIIPDSGKLHIQSIDHDHSLYLNKSDKVRELTQLYVFYAALKGNLLIYDVSEDWLQFLGIFGGITGLFMGCSFISVFEIFFLLLVRPACNWFTKQQIRYRLKRRQRLIHAKKGGN